MAAKTVKVKFLKDHVCQNLKESSYEKGKEYTVREDAAAHFAKRGLTELVSAKDAK